MPTSSIILRSWDEIHAHAKPGWIDSGQRSADWELSTSLERRCEREHVVLLLHSGLYAYQLPHKMITLKMQFDRYEMRQIVAVANLA